MPGVCPAGPPGPSPLPRSPGPWLPATGLSEKRAGGRGRGREGRQGWRGRRRREREGRVRKGRGREGCNWAGRSRGGAGWGWGGYRQGCLGGSRSPFPSPPQRQARGASLRGFVYMSSLSSLKRTGGGALGAEWQAVQSNGEGGRRQRSQWARGRRCVGSPICSVVSGVGRALRPCWMGGDRWWWVGRGEETGQRAREPGWGRLGCPAGSPGGPGSSSGEPDPTRRSPHPGAGGREVPRVVQPSPGVVPGTRRSSFWILPLSRP